MGVLGGMLMANWLLGLEFEEFSHRFTKAVSVAAGLVGIGKAPVFAVIIVVIGCFQGLRVAPRVNTPVVSMIDVQHLATRFGSRVVRRDISLCVQRAEVFALIGGSGSGQSTLLRQLTLLHRPDAGGLRVLGTDLLQLAPVQATALHPALLFLDQPTAGLDPVSAAGVDALVLSLRELFGLMVLMVHLPAPAKTPAAVWRPRKSRWLRCWAIWPAGSKAR